MARNAYAKAETHAAQWNQRHPIGTRCRYWRGAREGEGLIGVTSCAAFALSKHTAAVIFDGKGGAIALSHVEPIVAQTTPVEVSRWVEGVFRDRLNHDPHVMETAKSMLSVSIANGEEIEQTLRCVIAAVVLEISGVDPDSLFAGKN